jgi:hypothetical protein
LSLPDLMGALNLHEDVAFKLVRKGVPIAPSRAAL